MAVRWYGSFKSVKGKEYSVQIYDNNFSGNYTQLELADPPFSTSEDDDNNLFSPIRCITGTLGVIDRDGTLAQQLSPANDVSLPVAVRINDGSARPIFLGFISCEAYEQDYSGVAQALELNVNSILQAMASMEATQTDFSGYMTVRDIIKRCLLVAKSYHGVQHGLYQRIYFPKSDLNIIDKLINTNILFEEKEVNNAGTTTYVAQGKSCKDILEMICTFMGWCVREYDFNLYFMRMGDVQKVEWVTWNDFVSNTSYWELTRTEELIEAIGMSQIEYRGIGHTRSVESGAKSVEIIANTQGVDFGLELPPTPLFLTKHGQCELNYIMNTERHIRKYLYIANRDDQAHSNITYRYLKGTHDPFYDAGTATITGSVTKDTFFANARGMFAISNGTYIAYNNTDVYAGAFLAKCYYYDIEDDDGVYYVASQANSMDILYTAFIPQSLGIIAPNTDIFTMKSKRSMAFTNGYLLLSSQIEAFMAYCAPEAMVQGNYALQDITTPMYNATPYIELTLRFGSKYWNGSVWTTSPASFFPQFDGPAFKSNWNENMGLDKQSGIYIPLDGTMSGEIELSINGRNRSDKNGEYLVRPSLYAILWKDLKIAYVRTNDMAKRQDNANYYYELLGTNFRDEETVRSELATDMNNHESDHIVKLSRAVPLQTMTYNYISGSQSVRPELDLLARLAKFYRKAREIITIECDRPNSPLPITTIYNYGGSKYFTPVSEQRDWQKDVSTIKLVERPYNE